MIYSFSKQIDVDKILALWLSWLPVWEDDEEIPHIYGFLYDLLERYVCKSFIHFNWFDVILHFCHNSNNPVIIGPNNSNLSHIMAIIAEVFARMAIDSKSELGLKLIAFLQFIKVSPIQTLQ